MITNFYLIINSSGRECLEFSKTKTINLNDCFINQNAHEFYFKESNPLRIETNNTKQLKLEFSDFKKEKIKFKSSEPEIIKINNDGLATAVRPGKSMIYAYGFDFKCAKIEVIATSNYCLTRL